MKLHKSLGLLVLLMTLIGGSIAHAADFAVVLNNQSGTLLTAEEQVQGVEVNFGVAVAQDGTVSRVAADATDAVAVISGKFHSEHGLNNFVAHVKVDGAVKVGLGMCSYGSSATIVTAEGEEVASFTTKSACYKNDPANVIYNSYMGGATTLTISGGAYVPFLSVEAISADAATITYDRGEFADALGSLPEGKEVAVGDEYTLPHNVYLYKEGYTLTAWRVNEAQYAPGATITIEGNTTISPLFTANEVTLADRTEEVTISYAIIPAKGAPVVHFEGNSGIMVSQAVVNGRSIDVKMDIDATSGKFKTNGDTWVQINTGTQVVVPSCKGATIAIVAYSELNATTIEGNALNSGSKSVSYTCVEDAESATIVVGENTYLSNIDVTLPVAGAEPPVAVFRDIVIPNVVDMLSEDEKSNQTTVEFGVAVAEDGTVSRVAADDASAAMIVNGAYHNAHGMGNPVFTVDVEGPVKISLGNCTYGAATVVKDAQGNEVTTIVRNNGCYSGDNTMITYGYYKGTTPTTLSFKVQYCTYVAVEAVALEDIPTDVTVTYLVGEATGIVPKAETVAIGGTFEIPANNSLYVEGKTLTGWSDGVNIYTIGQEVTVGDKNIELTPVFTANEVTLADRTEAVTLQYYCGEGNGAPTLALEGANSGLGVLVAQATICDATIDVKIDIDATGGKFSNKGRGDKWAQINSNTKITVPACKGAVVSLEAYGTIDATTIDGVKWESGSTTPSFTCAGDAETVDIVMGENTYLALVQVVLPVVEEEVVIQERGIIMADFANWEAVPKTGGAIDVVTNFSNETITFTFSENVGLYNTVVDQNDSKFPDQFVGYIKSEKAASSIETTVFKNITRVRYLHGATGGSRGFKLEKKSAADADWVLLSDAYADPSTGAWVECDINEENVQLRWSNLNASHYAYMFEMEVYANVEITAEQVSLDVAASPAEGGVVSVYPASEQYDINTEVTLTAVENFGYDFVNWTDANGNVVGETAECKYVITENAVVTANFVAVNTYELVVKTEGGANDYMVGIAPEATVVDGKMMFEEGAEVTLTAVNNPILTFSNWASGETTAELVVTMDTDVEVTAVYSAVDYLVGWDFIRAGKNSRAADFVSSTDNENTVLVLRNAEGTVAAWLDKSQDAAGGYEGKPAAVNWQQLTDKYYYQTKVNALNFTDIKVQAEMLYNFIAYQVQILEYSLDGETWNEAARLTLPAAKSWTLMEATLPAECNNAEELYLRWIPDYTSSVVGSEGKGNDGTSITNIFVTGKTAVYDDGKAPVVVSTIPANGAEGVSATGRVVVNFDEKVQVAEGVKATLGEMTIEPVVSGKVLTFNYMGLDYNAEYTFTLPANSVSDLSGNTLAEAVSITFTTVTPPVVTPGVYDAYVTNADELQQALEAANGETRYRIFLYDGVYDLGETCLTNVKSNISLIGESMNNTIIVNKAPVEGIGVSATLLLTGSNIYMQDLTIKNAYDYTGSTGRAVCIQDKGDKNVFKNVRMLSYQDTYYTNNSKMRAYHENTEIHGTVDFICGGGDVFFNQSTLYLEERASSNCITAPNGDTDWGYVFSNCVIDGHEINNGQYHLGRPWNGTPRCVWLNTTMKVIPAAAGWTSMQVLPELFAEYNSVTESGNIVDLSGRTTTFTVDDVQVTATYNPVLTADEAAQYTIANVLAGSDQWQPNLLTEQATTPTLKVENGVVVWEASDYVFCYAVCRNGKVIEFTNDCYYVIPTDATEDDFFAVRAANNMGGLGVALFGINKEGVLTGIENSMIDAAEVVGTMIFSLDGMLLPEMQNGINIVRTVYSDGSVKVEKVVYRR